MSELNNDKSLPYLVPSATAIHIDSSSRMFIDVEGRTVLFHGVNVVYKVPPYIPSNGEFDPYDSLNDEDI